MSLFIFFLFENILEKSIEILLQRELNDKMCGKIQIKMIWYQFVDMRPAVSSYNQ